MAKIETFLWFDGNGEEAVEFYQSVFPDLVVKKVFRWGPDLPVEEGKVLTIEFELFGQTFVALNAQREENFTPAVSFMIACQDQAEVDRYWDALAVEGKALACGWIQDKYGVAWQITPAPLRDWIADPDSVRAGRAMTAMMGMIKLDFEALRAAYEG
jgi:predicted 3-demethylubiquinone-9 3-methyltransferase (glyoxalase superfamily)